MRPLKRPMFKYGGDVKRQGIMHGMNGLRDGGVATYMADATGYAGGGRAALVGNPIFPKGPDGRAMHNQNYTQFGGRTMYSSPSGVTNTSAAQNLSKTQKALNAAKSLKNTNLERSAISGIKNLFTGQSSLYKPVRAVASQAQRSLPFLSTKALPFAAIAAGPKILSEGMRPKTYKALEYMKQMNDSGLMDETAGLNDATDYANKLLEYGDTSKYTALPKRGLFNTLNPFSITSGLKGGRKEAKAIVKQDEEKIKKAEDIVAAAKDTSGLTGEQKKKLEGIEEQNKKDKLNKIYKLLGVDKAQKNAAAKALADMSRYIDEGGKDTISRKNIGSTLTKGILAFDKRLDKVDQLKEAAGLMIAKGEIEKDIYQSKGSDISKRINYLVNNYGYSKEQALSMVNKEPYDVQTSMAAAVAGKRGASLTNNERANALRIGANKEGKELQVVADRQAIKDGELAGKNATTIAEDQWESEADDGYYMYGSTIVEVKTVKGKPVAEIIEGSEIIKK